MIALAWVVIPALTGGKSADIVFLTRLFALSIPVILLNEMLRGQLEGARLFGWLGVARLSFIATQATGNAVFYWFDLLTLENAVWIIAVGQAVCSAFMLFAVFRELKPGLTIDWAALKKEIGYGLRSYPGILTEMAIWRLDQMMLAIFAPSAIVGLYTIAVAVAEITATLASSVADALLPEVAASDRADESTMLMGKTLRLTMYAQFMVLIPLWIAAPVILRIVYGEGFVAATSALRILLLASIAWSAAMIVISCLNGLGHPWLGTVAKLGSTATTVVTLYFLLPLWGMNGAAVSSLFGYATMLAVALICLARKQEISFWEFMRPRRQDVSLAKIKSFFKVSPLLPRNLES